jgi:ElaB/YqjD/DUF883 family membrane-anchored ribosome-binding protein
MPPETELIKQQMGQTRSALTDKLETLESKVFSTLDTAADTVGQTVHEVGSTVRETAENVRATMREAASSVRDAFDVSRHVQHHPWVMLGGSVVAGYVGGVLLDNLEHGRMPSLPAPPSPPMRAERLLPEGSEVRERLEAAPPARRRGIGLFRELADAFAPELEKLKAAAVGMALGALRDKINASAPAQVRENVNEMMDRITVKLGGELQPPGAMYGQSEEHHEGDGARTAQAMDLG